MKEIDDDNDNDNDNYNYKDNDNNNDNDNDNDNDNYTGKIELIYSYFNAILNFESKLQKDYDWNKVNEIYIIKLKDYEEFKDSISYYTLKKK